MLSIVHVYKDYWPVVGGIENHIKDLAEAEAALGHAVTVLVTNPGGCAARETINGVQVIRAGRLATVASTPLSLTLPFLLAKLRPDITNVHFPYPLGEVSQWLLRGKRPLRQLTNGPAKLTQALAIDKSHNAANLCQPDGVIWIEDAPATPEHRIATGPRIGLGKTPEPWFSIPWRYWLADNPFVSK